VSGYRRDALLTQLFWNWLLGTLHCCGVGEKEGWTVWKSAQLKVLTVFIDILEAYHIFNCFI
jgi:hypothetical protein